jgi:hypothetical protein
MCNVFFFAEVTAHFDGGRSRIILGDDSGGAIMLSLTTSSMLKFGL